MPNFEEIAKNHVESLGEVVPGFKYDFTNRKDFFLKVYFSYTLVKLDGKELDHGLAFGGAPGFIIDRRTLKAETISWGDLDLLEARQRELEEMYNGLFDTKSGTSFLLSLKSKYELSSHQLVRLNKMIEHPNLSKLDVIYELDDIVLKNKPTTF